MVAARDWLIVLGTCMALGVLLFGEAVLHTY
jgi:hypothetical protein